MSFAWNMFAAPTHDAYSRGNFACLLRFVVLADRGRECGAGPDKHLESFADAQDARSRGVMVHCLISDDLVP